jgi:RNA polymerase sigma factor (sigma-70 family)
VSAPALHRGEAQLAGQSVTARVPRATLSMMAPLTDRSQAAFEHLYDQTAQRLLVSLTRRTQDVDVARELWAECWAAAFEGWPRCRATDTPSLEAWVFGIARRRLADYWRAGAIERRALARLRWTVPEFAPDEDEELARVAELDALREVVADALALLPQRRRRAVALRIVDGLSYPDVAARLGCSEDAARAHVSRGLRALHRTLGPATLTQGA